MAVLIAELNFTLGIGLSEFQSRGSGREFSFRQNVQWGFLSPLCQIEMGRAEKHGLQLSSSVRDDEFVD
jgi:hypothetical protein